MRIREHFLSVLDEWLYDNQAFNNSTTDDKFLPLWFGYVNNCVCLHEMR